MRTTKRPRRVLMRAPKRTSTTRSDMVVLEKLTERVPIQDVLASGYVRTLKYVIERLNLEREIALAQRDMLAKGLMRAAKAGGELDLPIVAEIQKWWAGEKASYACDGCKAQVPWSSDTCPKCLRLLVIR